MKPWQTDSSEAVFSHPLFDVERRSVTRDGERREILAIDSADWVHAVPILPDGRMLLIRQWRYATSSFQLELPGGVVEGEDPRAAAARELAEETGYRAGSWRELGTVEPNPAILDNRLTVYLATELEPIPENERPEGDAHEEIEVVPTEVERVEGMIADGTIVHALMLSSFLLWDLDRRRAGRA